jgi:hypothetical protein
MRSVQGSWLGVLLDDNRMSVSGWTEVSFTASSSARRDQLPMGFNFRANDFLLQNNWLRFERTVDPTASTPTWGFRSDTILPGSDYRFTVARGLLSGQLTADHGGPNLYGIDPVQFYGELYLPQVGRGLDVKLGRHFCQYGAENIDTTQNYFVSRSYAFIYDPFTHTGLLTTLKLDDAWSVQNGLVTGADMFIDRGANPTYIGSVKWAPPSGRDSVLFAVIVGKGRYDVADAFNNPEVFDLVYTHKFSDRLSYTLDALYSFQTGFPDRGFVNDWAAVQYLSYRFAPTLNGAVRLEFFGDPQGWKTGFEGVYTALTTGVQYRPVNDVVIRPEVRFDYNGDGRPFGGKHGLFTAAMDVIVRW